MWDAREVTDDKTNRKVEKQMSKPLGQPMFHHGGIFRGGMVLDLIFSPDGNSLLTMAGTSFSSMNSMQIWDTHLRPLSSKPSAPDEYGMAPEWLHELAEAVSGTQLTLHGYQSTHHTVRQIQEKAKPVPHEYGEFGNWFFSIYGK